MSRLVAGFLRRPSGGPPGGQALAALDPADSEQGLRLCVPVCRLPCRDTCPSRGDARGNAPLRHPERGWSGCAQTTNRNTQTLR